MTQKILYHPLTSKAHLRVLTDHLTHISGTWTLRSVAQADDPRVLTLHWIALEKRWGDLPGYLEFLDRRMHRSLLRCFFHQSPRYQWDISSLSQHLESSADDIQTALSFCTFQKFLVANNAYWYPGPTMTRIENIGPTFEWMVMECLQRFCGATAYRCVVLEAFHQTFLGDLDVLAFLQNGLVMTIECKSGTTIPRNDIIHFLQRAILFPADIAFMLIDTSDEEPLTCRLEAITSLLQLPLDHVQRSIEGESLIYHIAGNIYIANTAHGIQATLKAILAQSQQRTDRDLTVLPDPLAIQNGRDTIW